ncbi:MAG: transposase [Candidatus Delongbacteria bacterium]|nr:transposase [Candidatus Delongbacteria bacterium]MBN2835247.1 transposase [Candidatus Delongbacteria bacterium]
MKLIRNQYYHIFNRTNNEELLFRSDENYIFFLKKYRYYMDEYFETIAYCLMPTHFHFLIRVKNDDIKYKTALAILLSSYTKALNKRFDRHGSLFQTRTKSILVPNDKYLLTLIAYIHQNPIRSKLVEKQEQWKYSSYQDYTGSRAGSLPNYKHILELFNLSKNDFHQFSQRLLDKSNLSL